MSFVLGSAGLLTISNAAEKVSENGSSPQTIQSSVKPAEEPVSQAENSQKAIPKMEPFPENTQPPRIETLVKKKVLERVMNQRVVITHAELNDEKGKTFQGKELQRYQYYGAMLVRASPRMTREVLTTYELYGKLIPFVDEIVFDEKESVLQVQGGIWKYRFQSRLHLLHQAENWIRFKVISGHFRGMAGSIFFEDRGEAGTLVYLGGEALGFNWPPTIVMERGAEIVFDTAGRKMRSFIEEKKKPGPPPEAQGEQKGESEIPRPRSRL